MIADDLFAGAGGWDLAAEALGIHARGVENMPAARATRDAAGLTTIHDDVWTYEPDGTAELLIASPPCQSFSAAGKGNGRKALDVVLSIVPLIPLLTLPQLRNAAKMFPDPKTGEPDERTALVLTPLWYAVHFPYRALAWEQVKEVLPVWEACADVLRELGWNVVTGKLYSEQYGVPQTRTRAFLLASVDHEVALPTPTHSRYYSRSPEKLDDGVEKWVSMAEALGGREDWALRMTAMPNSAFRSTEHPAPTIFFGHAASDAKWVLRNNNSANAAVRSIDAPAPTLYFGQRVNYCAWELRSRRDSDAWIESDGPRQNRDVEQPAPTITTEAHRWGWAPTPAIEGETAEDITWPYDRPSPTVVGTFAPDVVAAPGYRKAGDPPRQKTPGSVRITVEEAGVLQSFPDDFPWNGGPKDSKGPKFLQAGNAVPPLMALHALSAATGLPIPVAQPGATSEENVA